MLLRELIRVAVLALLVFSAVLLVAGIVAEATQQGLAPGQILAVVPLVLPSTFPYTIPAATLFAGCAVYGRIAADNELLALRSSGVNTVGLIWPGVLLGLLSTAGTFALHARVIPATHLILRTRMFNDAEQVIYTVLAQQHQITQPGSDFALYVQDVRGRRLLNPTFKQWDRGEPDMMAMAREATLHADPAQGFVHVTMKYGHVWNQDGTLGEFECHDIDFPLNSVARPDPNRRARDMTWGEMRVTRRHLSEEVDRLRQEIGLEKRLAREGGGHNKGAAYFDRLRHEIRLTRNRDLAIHVEQHMRPALAVGCLCFILIGCPLGVRLSRNDCLSAFLVCFLPVVLVYYPLMLCGEGMARNGSLPPAILTWAPDALFALAGLWLLRSSLAGRADRP
jgi:lipopolysaccharide export system permease protein